MKVKEILELTQTKRIADIAKEHLTIGEKRLRDALKEIGCEYEPGKKGWNYTGEQPEILERSIYDFAPSRQQKATANRKRNASIEKANKINDDSNKNSIVKSIDNTKLKASTKPLNSGPDAIDMLLMQNEKESSDRIYRGFYWDRDIIHFLDNVKHGNKSDLMNEIVRTVLKAKGLI